MPLEYRNEHDDIIKWKHFPRYRPFVRGIHRGPVNSPYQGLWRGAFIFSLIYAWINRWVNNREAGDLRCYRAHYGVIIMKKWLCVCYTRDIERRIHINNQREDIFGSGYSGLSIPDRLIQQKNKAPLKCSCVNKLELYLSASLSPSKKIWIWST